MQGSAVSLNSPTSLSAHASSGVLALLLSKASVLRLLTLQLHSTLMSRKAQLLPNLIYKHSLIEQSIQLPGAKQSRYLQKVLVGNIRLYTKTYLTILGNNFPNYRLFGSCGNSLLVTRRLFRISHTI